MRSHMMRGFAAAAAAAALTTLGFAWAGAAGAGAAGASTSARLIPGVLPQVTSGTQLWKSRYIGAAARFDTDWSVAVSPDETKVFVTGSSIGGYITRDDYATVAYSAATGAELWAAHYNGPAGNNDTAHALAVSPDGRTVFVTGSSETATPDPPHFYTDYATAAYDANTGKQLWAARYNGPGSRSDDARSVAVARNGATVFVTGSSYGGPTSGTDYATVAYRAATGKQLWATRYNGPGNSGDSASSVASPGSDKLYVTGTSTRADSRNYATVAYRAATGKQLWAARYNGGSASSLTVNRNGTRLFVTGTSATLAYRAATGKQLWAARGNLGGSSLAANRNRTRLFVTGFSYGETNVQSGYATWAYSGATGKRLWFAHYSGDYGGEFSTAVALGNGKVYVTGHAENLTGNTDFATVAYSAATGAQLWVARDRGTMRDLTNIATSLAVNRSGTRVFVTGYSLAYWSHVSDGATIAYQG